MSTTYRKAYATLRELVDVAEFGKSDMRERASHEKKDAWAGASLKDALTEARHGDLKGAKRMSPKILDLVNDLQMTAPRHDPVYRLDEGRWVDVARYVKGEPECWGDMVEVGDMPIRGINIAINVSAEAGLKASALDRVGVHIGSAVIGLQARGLRVGLYIVETCTSGSSTLVISVPINPFGGPIDVAVLSAVLRPQFFRRVLFAAQETYDADLRDAIGISPNGGYGNQSSLSQKEADLLTGKPGTAMLDTHKLAGLDADETARSIQKSIKGKGYTQ